jgi:hypothetical protein
MKLEATLASSSFDRRILHEGNAMKLRRIVLAFAAGAIAVLVFHQLALALLHAAGLTPAMPFRTQPTRPFGVPQVWSLAFWGGIWGVVLAEILRAAPYRRRLLTATVIGAIAPSIVAWLVVMPLKGQPIGGGWTAAGITTALLVNGAWGFGTILLLGAFESRTARVRSRI